MEEGRCLEELPPQAMPGGMPTDLLRAGNLDPGVSEVAKARFATLHAYAVRSAGLRPGADRQLASA